MSECEHHWSIDTIEAGEGNVRSLWFKCDTCGLIMHKLTTRTDAEIQAELDAQPTPAPIKNEAAKKDRA